MKEVCERQLDFYFLKFEGLGTLLIEARLTVLPFAYDLSKLALFQADQLAVP
jgi:hypothetical protein